jgi:ABC-type polar amino acid transport system ATPase subunit
MVQVSGLSQEEANRTGLDLLGRVGHRDKADSYPEHL